MVLHAFRSIFRSGAGRVLGLVAGVAVSGCRMPLVAPTGAAMTLVAAANSVPINGATTVTAVLIEGIESTGGTGTTAVTTGGGPPVHDGTVVTFTTSLGHLEPAEAPTAHGRATVQLVADGRSGTATITAFSGAVTKTLTVTIGAAAATLLNVTASPQALPATGGTTSIAARVADPQGNGLLGVPVSFSTTAGTLAPTTALTDMNGFATTALSTTAAATVTATAGGATAALTGTVGVTLMARTTLGLTAPGSAMVGVPASFSITPGGGTVITSASINFGDGTVVPLGAISSTATVTHVFASSQEYTVSVSATDSTGQTAAPVSTEVAVAPLSATATASPTTLHVNDTVVFTVTTAANAIVTQYVWDFGDGNPGVSSSPQITHQYGQAGNFVASVKVIPFGNGAPATLLVAVSVSP